MLTEFATVVDAINSITPHESEDLLDDVIVPKSKTENVESSQPAARHKRPRTSLTKVARTRSAGSSPSTVAAALDKSDNMAEEVFTETVEEPVQAIQFAEESGDASSSDFPVTDRLTAIHLTAPSAGIFNSASLAETAEQASTDRKASAFSPIAKPETAKPETAQPETAQPDTLAKPETAQPETAQAETAQPETAKPDSTLR